MAIWVTRAFLTLSPVEAISTISMGRGSPTGKDGSEFPPTRETTPLQSIELCLIPLVGSRRCDKKLHWLMLLSRRSRLLGRNKEPLRFRSPSKMLFSSSANSISEPTSRVWLWELKRLVRLVRRSENRGPRKLRKD